MTKTNFSDVKSSIRPRAMKRIAIVTLQYFAYFGLFALIAGLTGLSLPTMIAGAALWLVLEERYERKHNE